MKEKILRAHKEQSGRHHQNTEFFKGGVQIVHTLTKPAVAGSKTSRHHAVGMLW